MHALDVSFFENRLDSDFIPMNRTVIICVHASACISLPKYPMLKLTPKMDFFATRISFDLEVNYYRVVQKGLKRLFSVSLENIEGICKYY